MDNIQITDTQRARQDLRSSSIVRRDGIALDTRIEASRKITDRLGLHFSSMGVSSLHCYINFRSEVITRDFIQVALERGCRIVVPVVEELDGRQWMTHAEIHGLSNLKQGAYGLDEPEERQASTLDDLGAVIVPLVAFDRHGTRLGYGKGFYDRFLSELPRSIPRIGLAFAIQEAMRIPSYSHDEPLDIVVTELETIHCSN